MLEIKKIKSNFPIFQHHADLVYLDSASTIQTPQVVLDAMNEYYTSYRANTHRGIYSLSEQATAAYEQARADVAKFINAEKEEIIFTSGTTHGLNMLAYLAQIKKDDNIVLTRLEHHANLIPWQQVAKCTGAELRFIDITKDGAINLESAYEVIDEQTKIMGITAVSNALGTITPLPELIAIAKEYEATTIVDAAQMAAHYAIDAKKLDCDFLVFSGHKMYGPTGIGVLYGRRNKLEEMEPFWFGGDMIEAVSYTTASWTDIPWKFEAGTQNIAGAIGLSAAIKFIQEVGLEKIQIHEAELTAYLMKSLPTYAPIIGPSDPQLHGGIVSFLMNGVHPHDTAEILNRSHIAVRAGHHCAMPLMKCLDVPGTVRASFGVYNSKEDVDALIAGLEEVQKVFKR